MAILFYEGFDYFNQVSATVTDMVDPSSRFLLETSWQNRFGYTTGYNGGQCLVFDSTTVTSNSLQIPISQTLTSFCIGAHWYFVSNNSNMDIFTVQPATGTNSIRLTTTSATDNKSLNLYVNGALVTASGSSYTFNFIDPIDTATWQYIELQGQVTSTNQVTMTLYINGMLASSWSGAGFNTTPYSWNKFYLGSRGGNGSGTKRVDNCYLTSGEQLGVVEVRTLFPSADTAQKDGIPISGTTDFSVVRNYTTSMTNNYVAFSDIGDSDKFDIDDTVLDSTYSVLAAQSHAIMKQSLVPDNLYGNISLNYLTSSVSGPAKLLNPSAFSYFATPIAATNPNTGAAWQNSEINQIQMTVGQSSSTDGVAQQFYITDGQYPTQVQTSTLLTGDTAPVVSGDALIFSGSSNIRYTDAPNWHVTFPYSVKFEFYTVSKTTNQCVATVGGHVTIPQWPEWTIFVGSDGTLRIYTNSDNTSGSQTTGLFLSSADWTANTWYEVGFMFYSGRVRGYINGVQKFDLALVSGTVRDSSYGLALGGDNAKDAGRQFTGGIRNFSMGNTAFWTV